MNHTPEALQLARELDTKAQALGCPLDRFSDALRHQHARIAELEAQLYAVGAGGVGQSIHPQVQPDTSPAAWAIFTKGGFCRMLSQDRALIERTAAELGVKAEPMYRCTGRAPQPHTRARGSHNPAPQPTKTTP